MSQTTFETIERVLELSTEPGELKQENEFLRKIIKNIHYMARRYAHKRSSTAPSSFNDATVTLLNLGLELKPGNESECIFAKDAQLGWVNVPKRYQHLIREYEA